MDVQNDDSGALAGQLSHDLLADSATSACHENQLAIVVPGPAAQVVERQSVEDAVRLTQRSECQHSTDGFRDEWVQQRLLSWGRQVGHSSLGPFVDDSGGKKRHDGVSDGA